jgi:hypothetical protein
VIDHVDTQRDFPVQEFEPQRKLSRAGEMEHPKFPDSDSMW